MRFIVSILLLCIPHYVFGFNRTIAYYLGSLFGNIAYKVEKISKSTNQKEFKTVNANSNPEREDRTFSIWDKDGNIVFPDEDERLAKYLNGNTRYPEIDSIRYKKASKLDIEYFLSDKYPFDYIVLGDRAQIEEFRKGKPLNFLEEYLVTLGYGYDGRPFGEAWGIEDRCFNDYKFAEQHGEFLSWSVSANVYETHIKNGYTPPYTYNEDVNRDIRHIAYRNTKKYIKKGFSILNNETFDTFKTTDLDSVIRANSQLNLSNGKINNIIPLSK